MQLYDRLKKALQGDGGEALVLEIEREVADKAEYAAERKRLDAEVREYERKKKEELPKLREQSAAAQVEVDRVRKDLEKAERLLSAARCAESSLHFSIGNGIDRGRIALARTAWPWLHEAIEKATEQRRAWENHKWEKYRWWRRETVAVPPDSSDPDYRVLTRNGGYYKMERFGSNNAACEAIRDGMSTGLEQLERLLWRIEEPTRDEVAALMRAFDEATWAAAAKDVVWVEPKAPRYDKDGQPLAA